MSPRNGSRAWRIAFPILFRMTPAPLMTFLARNVPSVPLAEVFILGRRTGVERRTLLALFELEGSWYIGHPNGQSNGARNLVKTGSAVVVRRNERVRVTPVLLEDGAERNAVIKATIGQPFPANVLFRAARSHVDATGTYFRLERLAD